MSSTPDPLNIISNPSNHEWSTTLHALRILEQTQLTHQHYTPLISLLKQTTQWQIKRLTIQLLGTTVKCHWIVCSRNVI